MRHAERWRAGSSQERSETHPELTVEGVRATQGVADRLRELLAAHGIAPHELVVHDVDTPETRATARIVREGLGQRPSVGGRSALECLSPAFVPTHGEHAGKTLVHNLAKVLAEHPERFVLVCHDPQATWIARLGLRRRTLRFSLQSSELVWRRRPNLGPCPRNERAVPRDVDLEWVISPSDRDSATAIRDKIRSKMDSAKVLGTFLTALLTIVAGQALDRDEPSYWFVGLSTAGFAVLGTSIVLFFVALYRYDALLVPTRFWGGEPGRGRRGHVHRPPAPDVWVLAQAMVRIWDRAFTPALVAAGLGVALFVVAFAEPDDLVTFFLALGVLVVVAVGGLIGALVSRPRLGVND